MVIVTDHLRITLDTTQSGDLDLTRQYGPPGSTEIIQGRLQGHIRNTLSMTLINVRFRLRRDEIQ